MSTQEESQVENQAPVEEKKRVSIFNLPPGISRADDLRDLCKDYGSIAEVEFFQARGEKSAFGFVTYKTPEDAKYAAYMLRDKNFGGKAVLKVNLSDNTKKRADQGPVKKPKVKKPMTSLVTLTPKNPAQNVVPQGDIPVKKTWDNLQTAQQKQQPPQQNKRQGQKNQGQQRKNNNGQQVQAQGQVQQQVPAQNQQVEKKPQNQQVEKKPQQQNQAAQNQATNHQKPAGQGQQNGAAQTQNNNGAAPQGQGKKNNRNRKNQGQANAQVKTEVAEPVQQQAPAQPAATPVVQPAQQKSPQQKQTQQQQKQAKKQAAASGPVAFNIVVVELKSGATFHNVGVTQVQYDQHIAPLVRR